MMARIGNKLIAICSAAVGIIYAAGYVVTESPKANSYQSEAAIVQPVPSTPVPSIQSIQSDTNESTTPQATNTPLPNESPKTPAPITPAPKTPKPITPTPITPVPTPTPKPIVQNQKYQDGTYSGSGTNRFGTVEVEVTISKGKIANVDITSSRTRYPQKYIDPLPDEVISAQDYNIDTISGATRSSEDFINAVHEALTQAEGNN